MKRRKPKSQEWHDATDVRRSAYADWMAGRYSSGASLAQWADRLESQEPAAHQPAGFIKLYPSQ